MLSKSVLHRRRRWGEVGSRGIDHSETLGDLDRRAEGLAFDLIFGRFGISTSEAGYHGPLRQDRAPLLLRDELRKLRPSQ
jgi:hypothetical protein